ncbi:MAG: hypothetical protein ACXVCD_17155, partial [Pseudobdellovibrionaceae bacterium]
KLFKLGGYMKSLDIFGITRNNRFIAAQVKYTAKKIEVENFLESIAQDATIEVAFFFSKNINTNFINTEFQNRLHFVELATVFDYFKGQNRRFLELLTYNS